MRHRNFKLFFWGQGTSLMGTWMTRLATSWLVYRLTHSALLLGVNAFVGQILTPVFGPFAGVWMERMDRRKVLIWTQAAGAAQSLALAGLTLAGVITFTEVIALSALQGLINAFDMPARQSFIVQMVDGPEDLGNAIALNSSMANSARLVGPTVAGAIIAGAGEGWCFLIDGLSYLGVIVSLMMMRLKPWPVAAQAGSMWERLHEGWAYVHYSVPIRTILTVFSVVGVMAWPYTTLLPVFAGDVLHGGANALGYLTAAAGFGALVSALSLAARKTTAGLTRTICSSAAIAGAALIGFAMAHHLWLSMLLIAIAGFGTIQCSSASQTVIQTLVTEDKRARVMSFYTMAFVGSTPIGGLLMGALAHRIGAPRTFMVTGACCVAGTIWYLFQLPRVHAAMRSEQGRLMEEQVASTPD